MVVIQKNKFLIFFLSFVIIISCGDRSALNKYQTLENSSWQFGKSIVFDFEVQDTLTPKNLFINIRSNNEYEFSNIYLITELKFSDNSLIIDTLQYEMADASGNFLGTGFSEIKENMLFYKERKVFPVKGKYTLKIAQAMRKNGEVAPIETLKGIQDVGFSIEKIKE
jgi:gliding motility-associated lipoprotein GldH